MDEPKKYRYDLYCISLPISYNANDPDKVRITIPEMAMFTPLQSIYKDDMNVERLPVFIFEPLDPPPVMQQIKQSQHQHTYQ